MGHTTLMGNWKMYKSLEEVGDFFATFTDQVNKDTAVDLQLMVSDLYLQHALKATEDTAVKIGAQNAYYEDEGAFTGETSPSQLKSIGVENVLIGHSERRQYFGDTDETVNAKVLKALENGLNPIICIGESLEERNANQTDEVIKSQVEKALANVESDVIENLVLGYEPVWAIGTGETAEPGDANAVAETIREVVKELAGEQASKNLTILYGGSVKANNLASFLDQVELDGALVGSASLDADNFLEMLKVAENYA